MIFMVIIFALVIGALPAAGTPSNAQESAKDLYLSYPSNPKKGMPGLKVKLKLKRNGVESWAPMNFNFRSGDQVKFFLEANFSAYVSAYNLGSTGRMTPLFPQAGAKNLLEKQASYEVPQGDVWIRFDKNPGTEKVIFVFSAEPLHEGASAPEPSPGPGGALQATQPSAARPPLQPAAQPQAQPAAPAETSSGAATPAATDQDLALNDLNARALKNGRDLELTSSAADSSSPENYVVVSQASIKKPRRFIYTLKHY
jgi:hypothetical protein